MSPTVDLRLGDCLTLLVDLPDASIDAVVTDPPYGLKFMGKAWDHGVPGVDYWRAIGRTLKPGGYLLAFGGTRTFHRQVCAIEDAGFEVRDCLMWMYGSGFPKGKGCLKPAWEPITLARKPGPKVLPLGVDRCRVEGQAQPFGNGSRRSGGIMGNHVRSEPWEPTKSGRWPANVVHDGSDEVMEAFAAFGKLRARGNISPTKTGKTSWFATASPGRTVDPGDSGSAARFYACFPCDGVACHDGKPLHAAQPGEAPGRIHYCAKATRAEREGSTHPTVKPLNLMRWLVRLVAAPGNVVLDSFMGSGTTGKAAVLEGCHFIGMDVNAESVADAQRRIDAALNATPLFA